LFFEEQPRFCRVQKRNAKAGGSRADPHCTNRTPPSPSQRFIAQRNRACSTRSAGKGVEFARSSAKLTGRLLLSGQLKTHTQEELSRLGGITK
jgi:hypothetical protein